MGPSLIGDTVCEKEHEFIKQRLVIAVARQCHRSGSHTLENDRPNQRLSVVKKHVRMIPAPDIPVQEERDRLPLDENAIVN